MRFGESEPLSTPDGVAAYMRGAFDEFLFTATRPRKSLLGAASGRMEIHADLTKPTLENDDWQPSL